MTVATFAFTFNRKKRECVICGKKYKPNSPGQKYCSKCKEEKKDVYYRDRSRKNGSSGVHN